MEIPNNFLAKFTPVSPESKRVWDTAIVAAILAMQEGREDYEELARRRDLKTCILARTTFLS